MSRHEPPAPTSDEAATSPGRRPFGRPKHFIRVCTLEPCHTEADRVLTHAVEDRLGIGLDERTEDGAIAFEGIECTGLCDIAEAMLIDDEPVVGRDAVLQVVDELRG